MIGIIHLTDERYTEILSLYKLWLTEHPAEPIIKTDGFYHYAVERGILIEEIESCEFQLAVDATK